MNLLNIGILKVRKTQYTPWTSLLLAATTPIKLMEWQLSPAKDQKNQLQALQQYPMEN